MNKRTKWLLKYALERLGDNDNVAINVPGITDKELADLRPHFKDVKREFMGYVHFYSIV